MKSQMKVFVCLSVLLFAITCFLSSAIADDDKSLTTRAGKLTIVGEVGDMKLLLNKQKFRDGDGLSFEKKFSVGDRDVILVANNSGGTACPAQYFFVSITSQGDVKLSPEFGSCSDLPKIKSTSTSITVKTEKKGGRGFVTAVYENDTLTVDGRSILMNSSGIFKVEKSQTKTIPEVGIHPQKLILSKNWKNKFIKITDAKFQNFVDRLEVAGETKVDGDWIIGSGTAPHSGGSEEAAFAILISTGQVFGAMLEDGKQIQGFGFST